MAVSATVTRIKDYKNGALHYDWRTSGVFLAGYGYADANWVSVIEFTTTSTARSITLNITNDDVRGVSYTANYKILDAEDDSYINADYTKDHDGTITMNKYDFTPSTFELTLSRPLGAGTHYLYLWTSMPTSTNCYFRFCHNGNGKVKISYEEIKGCVYIHNGTEWLAYQPYIYNGTDWVMHIPYVHNGTDWVLCGG